MKKNLVYSFALLAIVLVSCKAPKNSMNQNTIETSIPLAEIGDLNMESAAITIQSAEIKGTSIQLDW